jgi:phospho-N-acetylmuramoyl-pentapeptide-transferase
MNPPGNLAALGLALSAVAFLMTVAIGDAVIRLLIANRIGKSIRAEGPQSHLGKQGTPTMGGVIFVLPMTAIGLGLAAFGSVTALLPLGAMLGCAALGALDDYLSLVDRSRGGLSARAKMAGLLAVTGVAAWLMYAWMGLDGVHIPFWGTLTLGPWFVLAALAVFGATTNAVNLGGGVDGLASGTAALAFAAYGVIAAAQGQPYLAAFCFSVTGAVLGFLWFNAHPARVFMGDAGSLALGGALAAAALMTGQWLLLPVIGAVFVAEAASVILQVGYFKATGGKRIFRMSPLHHHFELGGWSEPQVVVRFWIAGALAALLGVALSAI